MIIYFVESCGGEDVQQVFWDYIPAENEVQAMEDWKIVRGGYAEVVEFKPLSEWVRDLAGLRDMAIRLLVDPGPAIEDWNNLKAAAIKNAG